VTVVDSGEDGTEEEDADAEGAEDGLEAGAGGEEPKQPAPNKANATQREMSFFI